jgi:hypothetical protein
MDYRLCVTKSASQYPNHIPYLDIPAVICARVVILATIGDTLIAILLALVEGNCERILGYIWS